MVKDFCATGAGPGPDAILIVEDDELMQARLVRILKGMDLPTQAVCIADSLAQAREFIKTGSFSLVLVDIGLPDGSGIELIAELRAKGVDVPLVVLSAWSKPDLIVEAVRAGATGYLLKEREDIELSLSISIVFRGGSPIDPFVAQYIMEELAGRLPRPSQAPSVMLSPRETEVLGLIANGLSNQAIADQLYISRNTVECHIKSIYRKLEVPSRTNAINKARKHGLI